MRGGVEDISLNTAADLLLMCAEYESAGIDAELEDNGFALEPMVQMYDALARIKQTIDRTLDHLTEVLHPVIPPGGELIEGVGRVEATMRGGGVKWDSESILDRLLAQSMDERKVDEETGAFEPSAHALMRVIKEASPITTPSHGWRKTALKKRGLQLDEFSTVASWTPAIKITRESE